MLTLFVDDVEAASAVAFASSNLQIPGLTAGKHTFSIVSDAPGQFDGIDLFEPVTLDIQPETIVLVEITPADYQGQTGRPASVEIRLLQSGFTRDGRWGARWNRRLGWAGQSPEWPWPEDKPFIIGDPRTEPSDRPTFVAGVTVADIAVPRRARAAISRARRWLGQAECVIVTGGHLRAPWTCFNPWQSPVTYIGVDAEQDREACKPLRDEDGWTDSVIVLFPIWHWHAYGLKAGRAALAVGTPGIRWDDPDDLCETVDLDIRPGTIVLVDVRPRGYGPGHKEPSAQFRILPTGFAHSGRWGRRMARRLEWPVPDDDPARPG